MDRRKFILTLFPNSYGKKLKGLEQMEGIIQEIRMRANQIICIYMDGVEYYIDESGMITNDPKDAIKATIQEIEDVIHHLCNYSIYAYEHERKQGFITVEGGHRIGMVGQSIIENGKIKNLKHISAINIRIAHEIKGVADGVIPFLYEKGVLCNTIIISPPFAGKTTMLRDLIRQVSNGNTYCSGINVSVVDERSEIGGAYMGIPQNDLGIRTDLLDGCPKVEGMMQLIRAMSPGMLAVDEIGSEEDLHAIEQVLRCGCKIIATIHGTNIEEFQKKGNFQGMIQQKIFSRYVVLKRVNGKCMVQGIYNQEFIHV